MFDRRHTPVGVLPATTHALPDGGRARVRVVQRGDGPALAALLARVTDADPELAARRILRHDPRTCAALAVLVRRGGFEELAAAGLIPVAEDAEPERLVVAPGEPDAVAELLEDALRARARHLALRAA